jgi:hypothetical protein
MRTGKGFMEDAKNVGALIDARVRQLYGTKARFYRASKDLDPSGEGISARTLDDAIAGVKLPTRGDKRPLMLRTLKWSVEPDAFDEIATGREPPEVDYQVDATVPEPGSGELTQIETTLSAVVAAMQDALETLRRLREHNE